MQVRLIWRCEVYDRCKIWVRLRTFWMFIYVGIRSNNSCLLIHEQSLDSTESIGCWSQEIRSSVLGTKWVYQRQRQEQVKTLKGKYTDVNKPQNHDAASSHKCWRLESRPAEMFKSIYSYDCIKHSCVFELAFGRQSTYYLPWVNHKW